MHLFLEISSGPAAGRKLHLKAGQSARVGRTEWADFAIHEDPSLAEIHFQIDCLADSCQLRDLGTSGGTLLEGKPIVGVVNVPNGSRIRAGKTTFNVSLDDSGLTSTEGVPVAAPVVVPTAAAAAPAAPLDAVALCAKLSLTDAAKQVSAAGMSPLQFAERLLQAGSFPDGLRVVAFSLPKPAAVSWGGQMVRSVLGAAVSPNDDAALQAAESWAREPSPERCRVAQASADKTQLQTAAGWVAMAAFWSGDSLSPPGLPPVPPAEALTCQAVTGALLLAAAVPPISQMAGRFDHFLRSGISSLRATNTTAS